MKITRSALGNGISGLTLMGEFDAFAANPFLEQVEAVIQSGTCNLVVNLRLVLFINSTAIGSLVKARKRLRGLGGDMVLSELSGRVKDALDTLGLSRVMHSFSSDEDAVHHLTESNPGSVDVPSENSVLVRFSDADKQKAYTALGGLGRMASLDENAIHFTSPGDVALFSQGAEIKVKFRLPLFRRAYYFEVPCTVRDSQKASEGVKVAAEFGDIFEDDRRAIAQFVRDLRLLKDEIRSADD